MSYSDACAEADLSFGLDSVEFGQNAASIRCQCGQDLTVTALRHKDRVNYQLKLTATISSMIGNRILLCHSDKAHVVFWIAACF